MKPVSGSPDVKFGRHAGHQDKHAVTDAEPHDATIEPGSARRTVPPEVVAATVAVPVRDPQFAVGLANRFNEGLHLQPDDLVKKIALMGKSPLKFLRCMPHLFYRDMLGPYKDLAALSDRPAPTVQLCGDTHLGNFGTYRGADGHTVWGINDFDMTMPGPPSWDLNRLATSTLLAMQKSNLIPSTANGDPEPKAVSQILSHLTNAYLGEMERLSKGKDGGPAYLSEGETSGAIQKLIQKKSPDVEPRHVWIQKFAEQKKDGSWKFKDGFNDGADNDDNGTLKPLDRQTYQKVLHSLEAYDSAQGDTPAVARPLQVLDICSRVESGGSSYGQPRFYALVANSKAGHPPVILEIKQELPSPLVNWTGDLTKADAADVVAGQKKMGCDPNPLTGDTSIDGISYLVREREPDKGCLSDTDFSTVPDYEAFLDQAGKALARAHARSPHQAAAILKWAGEGTEFNDRLTDFSVAYARQTTVDWKAFVSSPH